jgi:serine protease Do
MTNAAAASHPLAVFSEALSSLAAAVGASTFCIPGRHGRALATAVAWRPGIAVTVAHVFRRTPAALSFVGPEGAVVEATLAGIDSSTDLAVFRMAEAAAPAITLGNAATLKAGSLVMAVGRSSGGDVTASHGIVNRSAGPWETWLGGQLDRLIRLDGGLHEGLSGAPVTDALGTVVGIATSALSRSYGMVVPASTVNRVVDALLTKGHVSRAFLGIGVQPVAVAGEEEGGLLITGLVPGGPAQAAGMLVGDILVRVDGQPASSLQALRQALSDKVGQAVQATVHRGGVPTELTLTVAQWPTEKRHRC